MKRWTKARGIFTKDEFTGADGTRLYRVIVTYWDIYDDRKLKAQNAQVASKPDEIERNTRSKFIMPLQAVLVAECLGTIQENW